jgi:O-antigen/teichoic acid export membrane protein
VTATAHPEPPPPAPTSGYGGRIASGLAWKAASRGTFELSKLVVAIVLARLLSPTQYGIAGMVLVVVAFEPLLAGVPLASALVQRPHISDGDTATVFWTNAVQGLVVCGLGVALAGPVAAFYGQPEVRPLLCALSVVFLLSALSTVPVHLLVREMRFRALELRSMAGVVVGAIAAIAVALAGGGPWALVVQQLGFFATSLVLLWVTVRWRPRARWSRASLRSMWRFGGDVSGTMLLFGLNQNADNILIGRVLGAGPLGAYALAYNIILVPVSRLTSPLQEVLYPVFSRLQRDRERLLALWLRSVTLVAAVAMPAMLGLVVVAPDAVTLAFGDRWAAAVPVVRILACVGLLLVLQGLNMVLLQALGRTRLLLRYAVVCFAAGLLSFVAGLHWGIVGVAACFAGASAVVQTLYMHLTARAVGAGLGRCVGALSGVGQAAVLAVAEAAAIRALLEHAGVGPGLRLAAAIVEGTAVYALALAWRAPGVLGELRALRRRSRRTTVPAAV